MPRRRGQAWPFRKRGGGYRERPAAGEPVRTVVRPKDRLPRPKRLAAAGGRLRTLQAEYEAWRDQLHESVAD